MKFSPPEIYYDNGKFEFIYNVCIELKDEH